MHALKLNVFKELMSDISFGSDITSTTEVSNKYQELLDEIKSLKEKNSRQRDKIEKLTQELNDVKLQNQVLQEQNKLYATTRSEPPQSPPPKEKMIASSQVSIILEDFDHLLDIQSKEIDSLMEGRDKLSSICFRSLALLDQHELTLRRYKTAAEKLINSLAQGPDSIVIAINDFASIGLHVNPPTNSSTQSNIDTSYFSKIIDESSSPEAAELIQYLNQLSSNNSGQAQKKIADFISSQNSSIKDLHSQLQIALHKRNKYKEYLTTLMHEIQSFSVKNTSSESKQKFSAKQALRAIQCIKQDMDQLQQQWIMVDHLIKTFLAFGERFPDDNDVQRCVMRMEFWLANKNSDIDVVQEIDFLLGMCLQPKIILQPDEPICKGEDNGSSSQVDCELVKEVRELKEMVLKMKNKIKKNDLERKKFISDNLSSALPLNSPWTQICAYLLHKK